MGLSREVDAAIAALGASVEDPATDFLVDPEAACRALDALPAGGLLVVRVAPELPPNAASGFCPAPAAPLWIGVERGSRTLTVAPLRAADSARADARTVDHVVLDEGEEPCCGAPSCDATRVR